MLKPSLIIRSQTFLLVGLVVFAVGTKDSSAQISDNSATIAVSGDAGILAFADDPVMLEALIKRSMWRFDNAIAAAFSRPAIELTNDSPSGALITGLDFTIGDEAFNFDLNPIDDELIIAGFGSTLPDGILATVTDFDASAAVAGSAGANVLSLDFSGVDGGGLAPGESILFNAQLGFDDTPPVPTIMPSFDRVFFNELGANGENSVVTVTFTDPVTGDVTTAVTTLEDQLGLFFTDAIHSDDGDRFFGLQTTTATVIPEPTAFAQIVLLTASSLAGARRRRRLA